MKKVIDADNQVCLEEFEESQTDEILQKYEALNKWEDVSVDHSGDIILWEDE